MIGAEEFKSSHILFGFTDIVAANKSSTKLGRNSPWVASVSDLLKGMTLTCRKADRDKGNCCYYLC